MATDGNLIPGLLTGGLHQRRGHYVGKRFTNVRRRLGLRNENTVFDSFRISFSERFVNAGALFGREGRLSERHCESHMRVGVYALGDEFALLREGINKVTYGAAADELIRTTGRGVVITMVSKRREKG